MMVIKLQSITQMNNTIDAVVHVGNLETIITINIDELPYESQMQIDTILQNYVSSLDTSKQIAKLAK